MVGTYSAQAGGCQLLLPCSKKLPNYLLTWVTVMDSQGRRVQGAKVLSSGVMDSGLLGVEFAQRLGP